ncbi:MAG TPA: hypothetical protein VFD58_06185 [Blastocatellia bacterium]|nr:hypothetical protein [Blastocatellia bacterium]
MAARIITIILALLLTAVSAAAQQGGPKTRTGDPQTKTALAPKRPPTLTLEIASVNQKAERVQRASAGTVCGGDQVIVRIRSADPSITPTKYAWVATGGRIIGDGAEVIFDTTGLPPGSYHITGQALYAGFGICNGDCAAYDTKTVRVTECPPEIICFTSPVITVSPEVLTLKACDTITYMATEVTGGQGYGKVTYTWSASAGKLTSNGLTARLDTCGVPPGTEIEVTVTALSEFANCTARGAARVLMPAPPPPHRELPPCPPFKKGSPRVDNACKLVLSDTVRVMQSDPQARLVIDAYSSPGEAPSIALARGRNVRDRIADGSLGVALDANRITVRLAGVTRDGNHIRIWFLPEGAAMPPGGQEVDPGPVNSERKTPDDELHNQKSKRKPQR